ARGTPWNTMPRLTFSNTVFQGNSAFSWNTKAMSCGIGPATRLPATSTAPAVGVISPPLTLSKVDLPQPLGPIKQESSPRATSSEVSRSARTWRASLSSPNLCETPLIRIATLSELMRAARDRNHVWREADSICSLSHRTRVYLSSAFEAAEVG